YFKSLQNIIRLYSRKFTILQMHYPTRDQELLAIIDSIPSLEHYLVSTPFVIMTDHQTLLYISTLKIGTDRHYRWLDYLLQFEYEIHHISDRLNPIADYLSRVYEEDNSQNNINSRDFLAEKEDQTTAILQPSSKSFSQTSSQTGYHSN